MFPYEREIRTSEAESRAARHRWGRERVFLLESSCLLLKFGQNLTPFVRHQNCVFKMRRKLAVGRFQSPAVFAGLNMPAALRDHRLNRERHSGNNNLPFTFRAKI